MADQPTGAPTIDVSPVQVSGPMRAVKARVIWADGKLYVARGSRDVTVFEVPEPPAQTDPRRGVWQTPEGLKFYRRGCSSCGYTLNRVPAADLMAIAVPAGA
jgi:hypothetical protein